MRVQVSDVGLLRCQPDRSVPTGCPHAGPRDVYMSQLVVANNIIKGRWGIEII